jgi:hypothetical protein
MFLAYVNTNQIYLWKIKNMRYTHSMVWNCACTAHGNIKPARLIDSLSESDLNLLLEREACVEYRYYRNCCGMLTVIKHVWCIWCQSDTTYYTASTI